MLLVTVLVFLGCTDDIPSQSIESSSMTVERENTVIFDSDSSSVSDPFNFNCLVPGTSRNQGMHQAVWESLFILNYATGKIDPWLGESFVANDHMNIWILNIRNDVRWSDEQTFDADDIVFTLNLLLNDASQSLSEAASMQQWVDAVEKVDSLTVRFYLKSPNPRFQVDYFSVRIWGGQDPFTFKFYEREKGWPIGTGAYQLVAAGETEFICRRRQDWWGAETGFRPLPVPEQLVWIVTGLEETRALLAAESKPDSVMDISLGAFESIRSQNPRIMAWDNDIPYAWMGACPRQLSVNHTISPWDKAEMRRALSLIIDRQQIIEIAEGTSVASKTIFVEYPAMQPYINDIRDLWVAPRDSISVARALIETNGWVLKKDGFYQKDDPELSLNIQTHEAFIEKRRIAEVIVEQLRVVGINATTRALAGSTWTDNKDFGKFEAVIDWDACGSINEPWFT
jgi:peptide/nickel transport system substrate-binding protein